MILKVAAALIWLVYGVAVVLALVAAATSAGGDLSTHLGQVAGVLVGSMVLAIPFGFLSWAAWEEGDRR